jgi:CheY-like chemotaxis protein
MPEEGGLIRFSLKDIELRSGVTLPEVNLKAGPYLELCVSDTGEGIEPTILGRIFDPYFTTKKSGEGTGLGLAVVQGIVKSYKGAIRVSSLPGKGTTFTIYLPRISRAEKIQTVKKKQDLPRGTERVLLVDDEESIVRLAKNMLEHLGYEVVASTNSLEALEIFKRDPGEFDLVLTDHIMPNLTGTELARRIHWINPEIPVVIITGMGDLIPDEQKESSPIKTFIMKPLVIHSLAEKIRQVLDQMEEPG